MGLLSKAAEDLELSSNDDPLFSDNNELKLFIENYSKTRDSFHYLLLNTEEEKLKTIISQIGSVFVLENGNCLVLVPKETDRRMLAHRLSESLKTNIICQCAADNAEEALASLTKFL